MAHADFSRRSTGGLRARDGPGRDRSGGGAGPARLDRALSAFVKSATKRPVFVCLFTAPSPALFTFLSALELRVFIATPPKSFR